MTPFPQLGSFWKNIFITKLTIFSIRRKACCTQEYSTRYYYHPFYTLPCVVGVGGVGGTTIIPLRTRIAIKGEKRGYRIEQSSKWETVDFSSDAEIIKFKCWIIPFEDGTKCIFLWTKWSHVNFSIGIVWNRNLRVMFIRETFNKESEKWVDFRRLWRKGNPETALPPPMQSLYAVFFVSIRNKGKPKPSGRKAKEFPNYRCGRWGWLRAR